MRRTPVHKPVDFRLMIPQKVGVLYVDSQGPVPLSVTVSICDNVNSAKGDDLKQIVRLPALNLSVSAGLIASTMCKYIEIFHNLSSVEELCFVNLFSTHLG